MKKYRSGIDIWKFIASLLVVIIHVIPTPESGGVKNIGFIDGIQIVARSAVPFYFIASSYFLFGSMNHCPKDDMKILKKYIKRILYIYVFWFIVNIPITFYFRYYIYKPRYLNAFVNQIKAFLFSSTFPGSWYLMASIFSAVVVYYLSKKISPIYLLIILSPFEALCIVATTYGNLIIDSSWYILYCKIFGEAHVTIFAGLFYFALGHFLYENARSIDKLRMSIFAFLTVSSFIMMYAEYVFAQMHCWYYTMNRFTFLPFFAGSIFVMVFRIRSETEYSMKLRNISVVIYCTQWIWISFLNVLERINIFFPDIIDYILVVGMCCLTGIIMIKISSFEKFRWLKKVM